MRRRRPHKTSTTAADTFRYSIIFSCTLFAFMSAEAYHRRTKFGLEQRPIDVVAGGVGLECSKAFRLTVLQSTH